MPRELHPDVVMQRVASQKIGQDPASAGAVRIAQVVDDKKPYTKVARNHGGKPKDELPCVAAINHPRTVRAHDLHVDGRIRGDVHFDHPIDTFALCCFPQSIHDVFGALVDRHIGASSQRCLCR